MKHFIMNKNTPVVCIETSEILDKMLCPNALKIKGITLQKINKWLIHRAIPLNRKNSEKIYMSLNLSRDNQEIDLMYITHGLSINDNFWVANEQEVGNIKYENISIFRNSFNEAMYMVALRGDDAFTITEKNISPEYTGQGAFPKCFVRENDSIYLYKSGTQIDIQNEIYAGYIAEILGAKTVHYDFVNFNGVPCTKSKIYTNESINWETAFILSEVMSEYNTTPQQYTENYFTVDYSNMIILDGIILNADRHMKNWSLEFDSHSNMCTGLAPNYDYNNAFRADARTDGTLIFDDNGKKVNILKAARIAYSKYGTTLRLDYLYNIIDSVNIPINKQALKNRLLYITGRKDNQRDCY